jgi:hypothetical protein
MQIELGRYIISMKKMLITVNSTWQNTCSLNDKIKILGCGNKMKATTSNWPDDEQQSSAA